MTAPLLRVAHLSKEFPVKNAFSWKTGSKLVAVDNVSFELLPGKTLGLVGESGCGKSTLAKLICCLEKPTKGDIFLHQEPLSALTREALRSLRKYFQPVFQDPFGSLNPRFTVFQTLSEPLHLFSRPADGPAVQSLLEKVGLGKELLFRYPHQLSGGQRQRLGIARALSIQPELLVADEPLSSLDVSIQAQVLDLLLDLQKDLNLTMLFISHDLRVVSHLSDQIMVMYLGRVMETAGARELFARPRHPYTQALLEALPKLQPGRNRRRSRLPGELPSPIDPGPGCRFYSRCPFCQPDCLNYENELLTVSEAQQVACRRWQELDGLRT
jgi:peptide/nickel transport system ATP-binding protein